MLLFLAIEKESQPLGNEVSRACGGVVALVGPTKVASIVLKPILWSHVMYLESLVRQEMQCASSTFNFQNGK